MTCSGGTILRSVASAALILTVRGGLAVAQTPATPPILAPAIGSTISADTLRDLPVGDNVYALLETTQPEVIADSFNSGGLSAGQPARVTGFFGSWSQTVFRVGDIDVSDPTGSGASLLFPETFPWERVDVATGHMPVDVNTSGLAVTLVPRRPAAAWTGTLTGSGAGGSLVTTPPSGHPPPITRLRDWAHGAALVSGPIAGERLGLVAGASTSRASKFQREEIAATESTVTSAFAHLVFAPAAGREWRTFGWVQRADVPFERWQAFATPAATTRDTSTHVQSTWEQKASAGVGWRVFGGFTGRSRTNSVNASTTLVNRIVDGPVPDVIASVPGSDVRRVDAGARISPSIGGQSSRHVLEIGADVDRATATYGRPFTGVVGEMIATTPARVWLYNSAGTSSRHTNTVDVFANDTIAVTSALKIDAGVRFESVTGGAEGATTGVTWRTWLPRGSLRWEFAERKHIALITGYNRTAMRLNFDWLAFGDPSAPSGVVSPWRAGTLAQAAASAALIAPVARVGPGTAGLGISSIDPNLSRPYTDEFVIGLEAQRGPATRFGMTGFIRREANLLGVVNTGVPTSSYSTIALPDAGVDLASPADDRLLTVYNRLPTSFGRDTYLVTNPGQQAATLFALKLWAQASTPRLVTLFGATAAIARGTSQSPGYGPLENDQERPGELFTDPNAATYAYGRLFNDRAFTIKWTTIYAFPYDFRVGVIARYQDGQPFARMVIVPGLNQGPEAVRAYPNGGSRFTYTGTLDLRVQKGFRIGPTRLDGIVDFYNLLTRSNEVEEYVVSGSAFRNPTAIEPTPAIHLGLRVGF